MEIKPIGPLHFDEEEEWYTSDTIKIDGLFKNEFIFIFFNYDESLNSKYETAINNILKVNIEVLNKANNEIFHYYKDCIDYFNHGLVISKPEDVWKHITFGKYLHVEYRDDDSLVYISMENECEWEPEHGLQIVFKNGLEINKIGQFDGHLTNSDAFAKDDLENIVYVSPKDL
jgi:hypothetical protein